MILLLKDFDTIENGAHFLNTDLHIHAYGGSYDVTDASMTPANIIDSAVRQGLSVISITDHNTNVNVQPAINYAQETYGNDILVLPGVEVTTAHGHVLVYFAPEKVEDLSKFLSRLDFTGALGAENTHTSKSMSDTILEAERLGGICIAAHIDREKTGFDKFAPGFQSWKKDIITSPGLYGLECDFVDTLRWYSHQDDKDTGGAERTKMFSGRALIPALSARSELAHLQGSDAHSMSKFEHSDTNKSWTRIKLAELSFEAVRVALIDPTARVRASVSVPKSIPRILAIAFTGGFLHEEMIRFSDNLNCFIGGRGTGKSTAIRAIAYGMGLSEDFGEYENCPDSVTIFCEDENGIQYRYIRSRGNDIDVKAKEDKIIDVPVDSFHLEYFGQGEMSKVAEDPLANPELFQAFLDRHTNLRDLIESEELLVASVRENATRLNALESAFWHLGDKRKSLAEIEKKLKVAEEGNLREVVGTQSKLASEKTVRESIDRIAVEYKNGVSLSSVLKDYDQLLKTAGTCTGDLNSIRILGDIKTKITDVNLAIQEKEKELNTILKGYSRELTNLTAELKENQHLLLADVSKKLADLKSRGLATDIPGLELLLKQKTSIATDIASVEQKKDELSQCQNDRAELLKKLEEIRRAMTDRRKRQLRGINSNLRKMIDDYSIFVKYDDSGIISEFVTYVRDKMQGSYFPDNLSEQLCKKITPHELSQLILDNKSQELAKKASISLEWAERLIAKLRFWPTIFELQALAKQPKPIITVETKTTPKRYIPVLQLSDGQRHTILLTIAMLAESNVPLIIDQPEDDLDNAFIFSSIVSTLREIKERRQVILVTHNANIAVLGDSELILPMYRENDTGKTKGRGSIDAGLTKGSVLNILEGGPAAFDRRKEIYNH